ncbi:MAG: hypothetical protein WBY94_09040 [Polyangiaceae bacterium]
MNLVARRVLVGAATAFCLAVACGGGVDSAWKNASGTTLGADGTCGPCSVDSDCQNNCGLPAVGYNTWCCALNTSPPSCYNWEGIQCPAPAGGDDAGGVSAGGSSSSSGGTAVGACVGRGCDAGSGATNKRPCRGRKCDAGGA